ncbi:MAG: hypothetical protein O2923_13455 [Verrucomicrobia bacterium]|nr:hypothetical protein [Verrucomicrobiota bacterium]
MKLRAPIDTDRGVLTFAQGKDVYFDMAVTFALSVRMTNPHLPLAVITDREDSVLNEYYDFIILHRDDCGDGFVEKMYVNHYTPFRRTLYLDADMLVIKDIESTWDDLDGTPFVCLARKVMTEGYWYGDVASHCKVFDLEALPTLNAGLMYFEKCESCDRMLDEALAMVPDYDDRGLKRNRDLIADEPLLAIVMHRRGMPLFEDDQKLMASPMDCAWFKVESLTGTCSFETEGVLYSPAIVHFSAGYWDYFHYRRERAKMRMFVRCPFLGRELVTALINATWNSAYVIEILLRRFARRLLRGQQVSFRNWLPASRYM